MKQLGSLVLGSQSPRRKELLALLGLDFEIQVIPVEEIYDAKIHWSEVPEYLARLKAQEFNLLPDATTLITADTVVVHQDTVLGKPSDKQNAFEMLKRLQGSEHLVITGVNLRKAGCDHSFSVQTKVVFDSASDIEIDYYLGSYHPFDKAGSYGVQDWWGGAKIKKLEGCYYNVMGLPVNVLYNKLQEFGVLSI